MGFLHVKKVNNGHFGAHFLKKSNFYRLVVNAKSIFLYVHGKSLSLAGFEPTLFGRPNNNATLRAIIHLPSNPKFGGGTANHRGATCQ